MNNKIYTSGGLVIKNNKILFIKKNGIWDLPKGKIEKGHKKKQTAIKEISEETGLNEESLIVLKKLVPTFYHKTINKQNTIKKTDWYLVEFIGDLTQQLIPDKNEGITHCKWFKNTEIEKVKNNCHIWIQYLLKYLMEMPYYKKYISTKISSDI